MGTSVLSWASHSSVCGASVVVRNLGPGGNKLVIEIAKMINFLSLCALELIAFPVE